MNRRRLVLSTTACALLALAACSQRAADAGAPAASAPASARTAAPSTREGYELAAKGNGFTTGPVMAANTVYVFFDTTCPHCAALWTSAGPLAHKLKIVWMPVGLLHRSSAPQGATILSAPDPAAAMTQNEASVLSHQGGITASPTLSDEALAKVRANTELFNQLGADSVPLILYKNARTGAYGSYSGSLQADQLVAMVGL